VLKDIIKYLILLKKYVKNPSLAQLKGWRN